MITVLNQKWEMLCQYDKSPSDKDRSIILECSKRWTDLIVTMLVWWLLHWVKYIWDKMYFYKLR